MSQGEQAQLQARGAECDSLREENLLLSRENAALKEKLLECRQEATANEARIARENKQHCEDLIESWQGECATLETKHSKRYAALETEHDQLKERLVELESVKGELACCQEQKNGEIKREQERMSAEHKRECEELIQKWNSSFEEERKALEAELNESQKSNASLEVLLRTTN